MEKAIKLNDRLYDQIKEYCNINDIKINDYITNIVKNGFYTDKYGDLNIIKNEILNEDDVFFELKSVDLSVKDVVTLTIVDGKNITLKYRELITNGKVVTDEDVKSKAAQSEKRTVVRRKIVSK